MKKLKKLANQVVVGELMDEVNALIPIQSKLKKIEDEVCNMLTEEECIHFRNYVEALGDVIGFLGDIANKADNNEFEKEVRQNN